MLDLDFGITQLNAQEKARLTELEVIIAQGIQTFYKVGKALIEIRDNKLYRETHKTFELYCREKWNMARRTAYQLMDSAKVMENLCAMAHKFPTNERQVRPLTGLPAELQQEIWQEAVESSPNGTPTGATVKRLVEARMGLRTKTDITSTELSQVEQLQQENKQLKEKLRQQEIERKRRAAEVAAELERLRFENQQLKAELYQRDIDWERRLAYEREKIRQEVRAEMKAEYEGQINTLTNQVESLKEQLAQITTKYQSVLARLDAIEGAR